MPPVLKYSAMCFISVSVRGEAADGVAPVEPATFAAGTHSPLITGYFCDFCFHVGGMAPQNAA